MKMKKMIVKIKKKTKGITLIALVVTIVVLLILAGVSISMLAGEDGIVRQAIESKDDTRGGEVKDKVNLAVSENKTADYSGGTKKTREEVITQLHSEGKLTDKEVIELESKNIIKIGNIEIDFTGLGYAGKSLIGMYQKAQSDGCTGGASCTDPENHLHVGDYVAYTPVEGTTASITSAESGYYNVDSDNKQDLTNNIPAAQTYTITAENKDETTWRVLGLNESGTELLLISGSPVKKDEASDPYLILGGPQAYANCETVLDKVAGVYHNDEYASETRSIRIEDINRALGITVAGTKVYKNSDSTKTNIDLSVSVGWLGLGQKYTYKSGDYAPENYLGTGNKKVGDTVTQDGYIYSYEDIDENSVIYDLLFKGTTSSDNYAKSYWLASPAASVYSSNARFGPGAVNGGDVNCGGITFDSYGLFVALRLGVRPVVSLKSNISKDDLAITRDNEKDETTWSTSSGVVVYGYVTKGQVTE